MQTVTVIGGGLAGSEAAWQLARQGVAVRLYEMRPVRPTDAHQTDKLAELVCSNSFRSAALVAAVGLLKEEMRGLGSLVMEAADAARVPAGQALAVDRHVFAQYITDALAAHPLVEVRREEVRANIPSGPTVIASGPLTSPALSEHLRTLFGREYLYFYDAISPVVTADSIDTSLAFRASRYDHGGDDYLNCPSLARQSIINSLTTFWPPKRSRKRRSSSVATSRVVCRLRRWPDAAKTPWPTAR